MSFKLPRVTWSDHGVKLFSFRRDMLQLLGQYLPEEGAVLFDPVATGVKSPEAVAQHELTHQFLSINSTFGLFTWMLYQMTSEGMGPRVLQRCLAVQWCVQELVATYWETTYIATMRSELLQEQIRSLPSARLDQPPYREVFEAMNRFLPVDSAKSTAVLSGQGLLVRLLALAAMNSDCLLQMASGKGTEGELLRCMADSPTSRLEQIMNKLIAGQFLEPLLAEAVTKVAADEKLAGTAIYQRLISLVPEVPIQTDEDLAPQAKAASAVYESVTGRRVEFVRSERGDEPRLKIMESSEMEQRSLAANPPRALHEATLREFFDETLRQQLGLTLELAVPETGEAYVTVRRYFLRPNGAPQPASPEEYPSTPLPKDVGGLISAHSVLSHLRDFPTLPHVAIFIDDSWRSWYKIPGARERLGSCIRICRQTHLSQDFVFNNILRFELMTQFFVVKLRAGSYVGCFFNPDRPLVYGLQKIASDYGVHLFTDICEGLGLPRCAEPRRAVPHVDLLIMISHDYNL